MKVSRLKRPLLREASLWAQFTAMPAKCAVQKGAAVFWALGCDRLVNRFTVFSSIIVHYYEL